MTSTTEEVNVEAVARLAPAGKPSAQRTWIAPVPEVAAMLRAYPGDPTYPDADPRSGWRLIGYGSKHQAAKLSQDRMRIIRGNLTPFVVTDGSMFEASVSTDPNAPGRMHPAELWARWLTPEGARIVMEQRELIASAGGRYVAARDVREPATEDGEETPETVEVEAADAPEVTPELAARRAGIEQRRAARRAETERRRQKALAVGAAARPAFSDTAVTGLPS